MIKKGNLIKLLFLIIVLFVSNVNAANYKEIKSPSSNGAFFNNLDITNCMVADPYILKEKDTYYVYGTNLKIYKSKDFKKWTYLNKAIKPEGNYIKYWAPEVYKYNNKYYMFYTGVNDDLRIYDILVAVSDSPEGPFVKKAKINTGNSKSIDPNVLFDGDKIYLYTKKEANGLGATIYVEELNSDLLSIKKGSKPIAVLTYDENSPFWETATIEAPYVFKEKNKYYLTYSTYRPTEQGYTVGYAVSNSPKGPFTREVRTRPLLTGEYYESGYSLNSNKIYSTGHNSILKISDDERYIIYHSNLYENNNYVSRKLTVDYLGFDSNGKLFVNGPSVSNQPLPSGIKGLYKINVKDYKIESQNKEIKTLHDNVNYNALNTAHNLDKINTYVSYKATKTNSITITPNTNYVIEDIWLFGTAEGFKKSTADIIINSKYIIKKINLGNGISTKIQIPKINEKIKSIKINFSSQIALSEVSLYGKKENSLIGDVDGDGKVKTQDYLVVRKYILNKVKLTDAELKRADVNHDGKVSVQDYIEIRKIILNI